MNGRRNPKYITPPNKLKDKMGTGGIDEYFIVKAQTLIEKTEVNFSPIAAAFLNDIKSELKKKEHPPSIKLINAIMQLKGNGGMFRYQLISDLAYSALNFIEKIQIINKDAAEVLGAYLNAIEVILASKLTGDGGTQGYALVMELNDACDRYFKKHPLPKKKWE